MDMYDEECTTPRNAECRIPPTTECPPAPRKPPPRRINREPLKNGYFNLIALDELFAFELPPPLASTESCV